MNGLSRTLVCAWVLWHSITMGSIGWYVWDGYESLLQCRVVAVEYRRQALTEPDAEEKGRVIYHTDAKTGQRYSSRFVCLPSDVDPRKAPQ